MRHLPLASTDHGLVQVASAGHGPQEGRLEDHPAGAAEGVVEPPAAGDPREVHQRPREAGME